MVYEAQEKLLEYRQIVILEFFLFNLTDLVSMLGCIVVGSVAIYSYNNSVYPLESIPDWSNTVKLAGKIFSRPS
jgi:hypothetical protein